MLHPLLHFRCTRVRQEGRSVHASFANPGQAHFTVVLPEEAGVHSGLVVGHDYELSFSEVIVLHGYAEQHPEGSETFEHTITQEDIDLNPDIADRGINVGDVVDVPYDNGAFEPPADGNDKDVSTMGTPETQIDEAGQFEEPKFPEKKPAPKKKSPAKPKKPKADDSGK